MAGIKTSKTLVTMIMTPQTNTETTRAEMILIMIQTQI